LLAQLWRGSLAQFHSFSVVAVPVPQPTRRQQSPVRRRLELIQGSLSARQMDRQAPWLASLHRISDGTLAGLGLAVVGLSALTLHWQGQWTRDFQQLEAAQRLEHRLQESAAVLEQHHLAMTRRSALLQPTSSEKLLYVTPPARAEASVNFNGLLAQINPRRILAGY
jgi:fructosamine-3-kinase